MKKYTIDMKLPSLNDYIYACRANKYGAASMKKKLEEQIAFYLRDMPMFDELIKIHFTWIEKTKRRDYDNICFAKKFILDSMVKSGKLKDDNRNYVCGFTDSFEYGDDWKVIVEVEPYDRTETS